MELSGGSWIWSASLRYLFMLPFLLLLVYRRKNLKQLWEVMMERPKTWLLWSTIGFGIFYALVCFSIVYSPGWLIAGTWQITIISGTLLVPLFSQKIPIKGLMMSMLILVGIALMQLEHANSITTKELILGTVPVIIATFMYPLGNRKMMEVCDGRLDAYQRVLGMTIASMPFWIIISIYGLWETGLPSNSQVTQSILVAVNSGVIATILFFKATDMVRGNMQKLGAIEATQSLEVPFALIGEIIFLSVAVPSSQAWIGMGIIIIGMILHSYYSHKEDQSREQTISA
jgi:uncharacterized membrane protein